MQNLKRNWFVVSKMTRIRWVLTRALRSLKKLHFIDFYYAKYLMLDLKNFRGVIFHDTEKWWNICRDLRFGEWHEEFSKFSPDHSKVSKLGLWWDPFVQSRKFMSLKFIEDLCVMTIKNDTKIEEELTCYFKIIMGNLKYSKVSKTCPLNGLLLTDLYNAWAKEEQCSYLSWHWRVIQNLKKNWLVVWKTTWGIWQMFTRALESVKIRTLMGFFRPK